MTIERDIKTFENAYVCYAQGYTQGYTQGYAQVPYKKFRPPFYRHIVTGWKLGWCGGGLGVCWIASGYSGNSRLGCGVELGGILFS